MRDTEQHQIYDSVTEKYAGILLRWAVKKTGNRQDGEDLAQEVLLQVFVYLSKGNVIRKMDNFIWKVAHHCWCNYLRKLKQVNEIMPLDETMPADSSVIDRLAEDDFLRNEISRMRRRIADLSKIQREAMVLHYLEGLSVRKVAERLEITESAVKKHLFEARNRLKRELDEMKTETSYVYRPGRLKLGISGLPADEPDTVKVNDSIIRQNLLLLCSKTPKKIDELAELTGIPKSYLESELDWLTQREFLDLERKKYSTIIPVIGKRHKQAVGELYTSRAGRELVEKVVAGLQEKEFEIRSVGFYGADFSADRLLWPVMMLFLSYFSRNSKTALRYKKSDDMDIRPDGGRYYVIGNDLSDNQEIDPDGYSRPEEWKDFYGIVSDSCATEGESDSYYWLGLYNFTASEYHPDIINGDVYTRRAWHRLFCSLLEPGFSIDNLTDDEKEMLSRAVQKIYVSKKDEKYKPQFLIFTGKQLKRLQDKVCRPLLDEITPEIEKLVGIISAMHAGNFPAIKKNYLDYLTYLDLWNFGIYSFIKAASSGLLYLPNSPEEGATLTLVLVR
ncbi:MAG: RNA polymerase sigma factor [Dehalococcoidales bacterium]|nr:RNA polymerase sigma factor [Dehalococcoidales bacterium]